MDELTEQFLSGETYYHVRKDIEERFDNETCSICCMKQTLLTLPQCLHSFCKECLKSHLEINISEGLTRNVGCPNCQTELPEEFIKDLVTEKRFEQYCRFLKVRKLELDIYVKWCPVADCKGFDVASEENINLTCNECGHQYCYGCSEEWHKGKCKDSRDLGFKIWSLANNLKICPRCKNSVQKEGGCSHMTCPRCKYHWCWVCGKNYLNGHNGFNCLVGKNYFDLYWPIIIFLLFFPVMVPFLFFFMVVFFYQTENIEQERLEGVLKVFKYRCVVYPFVFCLSPAIEVIIVVGMLVELMVSVAFYNSRFSCWRFGCGILLSAGAFVLGVVVLALLLVIVPLAGVFFLFSKFYFTLKRCRKPKKSIEYPRLLI